MYDPCREQALLCRVGQFGKPSQIYRLSTLARDASSCPELTGWLRAFAIEAADYAGRNPDYRFSRHERCVLDEIESLIDAWQIDRLIPDLCARFSERQVLHAT